MSKAPGQNEAKSFLAWLAEIGPVMKGDGPSVVHTPEGATRGVITGTASTELRDLDKEILMQKGLDIPVGIPITLEHPAGVFNCIGEVTAVRKSKVGKNDATEVDAELYLDDKLGRLVWEKACVLKKAGASYQLGFSVEGDGRRDQEDPTTIVKSTITSIAVTMKPRNPEARWSPQIAKGSLIPTHFWWVEMHKGDAPAGGIGYPTQAEPVDSEGLGTLVPQTATKKKRKVRKSEDDDSDESFEEPEDDDADDDAMDGVADDDDKEDTEKGGRGISGWFGDTADGAKLAKAAQRFGLSVEDLAIAYMAKRAPEWSWGHIRDRYQQRNKGAF